jgi:multidrug efflux pump
MTRWAIKNYQFTLTAIFLLLIAGVMAYFNMPRSEDPGFVIRTARVTTLFPGATPSQVELLVTDPLEEAIQEIPELDYIKSESQNELSSIDVYIRDDFNNIRPIWDNLRRKVNRVRAQLPDGVIGPDVNDEFGDVYGTVLALTGDGYSYAELKDIGDMARDELLRLEDVSKVVFYGEQKERIFVEYNEARLAEFGLSATQLQTLLQTRNILLPSGHISNDLERIPVETSGNFEDLDELRHTVIPLLQTNQTIFLKDIADVYPGYVEPAIAKAQFNGRPALILAISLQEGGNIVRLGEQVTAIVDQMRRTYPVGVDIEFSAYQTDIVDKIISNFSINLLEAVAIVIAVMLLSLGLRLGLLVASVIPAVILITFVIMGLWGIGLDQISLAALVIALGLMVDNSIVVNEGILVEVTKGADPTDAAIKVAGELRRPLLISSLTTSAAFLPIYLAQSSAGEYTRSIFQVVMTALLCSWLLAMTMSPLLATRFTRPPKQRKESLLRRTLIPTYTKMLTFTLRWRTFTLLIAASTLVLGLAGLQLVPSTFFPNNERPVVTIGLEMPATTPIETTEHVAAEFEQFLSKKEDVLDWTTYIGSGAPRYVLTYSPESPKPEYAYIMANLTTDRASTHLIDELREWASTRFLDLELTLRRLEYGPIVKYPIEVRIQGRDYETLIKLSNAMKKELATIPGSVNISDDWGTPKKKLAVDVDQAAALRAGVTSQDVANSLQTYLVGFETTKFRRGKDLIPILLRSEDKDREDASRVQGLSVYSQGHTGAVVPLLQVAKLDPTWQPPRIFRRDRLRTVTVRSDLLPGYVAEQVLKPLLAWTEKTTPAWPPGYSYAVGGEEEESSKAEASIYSKIPISILVILLLLMIQFNSWKHVLIILLTVPLSIFGVVIGLLVTRNDMGFIAFLGVIALAGIVIVNGVVLLDRIRLELDRGLAPHQAVVTASRRRLIPIILTAATTIGGMIPLIIGGGPMFSPMAVAIAFGLLFSTAFNIFVIPNLYTLFFRIPAK